MTVQAARPEPAEETADRYARNASAEQLALAYHSVRNPGLRERLQLALMRGMCETAMPGVGKVAARDRYYEATHGGDWEEDH